MHEKTPKVLENVRFKYQLPDNYLLTVGSINERKNLLGMVKALKLIPEDQRLPLVVIGKGGSYKKKVLQYIRANQLGKWVSFLSVDFDDLPAIYQNADVFLYPSFFEGFGIPVLEALFSKTPVITSNKSSLPEAGGTGATLIDPSSAEAIAEAIQKIVEDAEYRQSSIEAGYKHAQKFKGEPLTHQMMDLYEKVLGQDHFTSPLIT
jgi:glycosyltransferase involved in cell wall biosynthesis